MKSFKRNYIVLTDDMYSKIFINASKILSICKDEALTMVVGNCGTVVYVRETPEQILEALCEEPIWPRPDQNRGKPA
jgi:hypothetical protein